MNKIILKGFIFILQTTWWRQDDDKIFNHLQIYWGGFFYYTHTQTYNGNKNFLFLLQNMLYKNMLYKNIFSKFLEKRSFFIFLKVSCARFDVVAPKNKFMRPFLYRMSLRLHSNLFISLIEFQRTQDVCAKFAFLYFSTMAIRWISNGPILCS